MFPIILIAGLVLLFIACLVGIVAFMDAYEPLAFLSFVGLIADVVLVITFLILWPSMYYSSVGEVTGMEAFYHDTLDAYEYTVAATGNIEITNAEAGLVDIAYNQQGVATSERLRELRDKIEWFNARLRHYERFNSMFIADPFLADLPSDLAPITLGINTGGTQ